MKINFNSFLTLFKINLDKSRIYGLDILRVVAIISVMIGHGAELLPPKLKRDIFLIIPDGVSIFFVLSGFLIGGILIKMVEKDNFNLKDLFNFWQRRWLRTLPMYYFVLVLLCTISFFLTKNFDVQGIMKFFIFGQNFSRSTSSFFTVSWSLAVEEWFYLITPLLLVLVIVVFRMKPQNGILSAVIMVIVLSAGYRCYRYLTIFVDNPTTFDTMFRRPVVTRLDSLMVGVLGAFIYYYKKEFWIRYKTFFFISGLLLHLIIKLSTDLFLKNSVFYYCNLSFVAESTATVFLLPFLSQLKNGKGVLFKVITYVSLISYSLYLLHAQIVLNWILKIIPNFGLTSYSFVISNYFLYWSISILLSILSFKYVEMYFINFRKKDIIVNLKES